MKRRDFVKALGIAAGTAAAPRTAAAEEAGGAAGTSDPVGVLVDTTKCIGCRTCEFACAEANGLPEPDENLEPTPERQTSTTQWTVVQAHQIVDRPIFAKRQCLHCLQPACASACLTKAMRKTPDGPVTWEGSKCMGCRYCMVSCPFDVPKFEYHSANPRIQKCQLCSARVVEGRQPACVEACPAEALMFGRRENLLEEARHRIYTEPDRYVHHIYGEHEAGGTSWLYLSAVPFDQLGFRTDIATTGYPTFVKEFLYAVPQVDVLAPLFLLGLARAAARQEKVAEGTDEGGGA
jgi:Fe-S-cluster-containing dehydrogenase component